jgi:phosphoribosylglycinamide formyltransferase-1
VSGVKIAIFASGSGSGFEALARTVLEQKKLDAEIVALVCDRKDAPVLEKARALGIKPLLVPADKNTDRDAHEGEILKQLAGLKPHFIVLSGYMRIMTPRLIDAYKSERGYHRAFRYGTKVAGCTVHLVDHGLDSGPICAQEAFSIAGCADVAQVEVLGKKIEHRLYPETLAWVLPERFEVKNINGRQSVCSI